MPNDDLISRKALLENYDLKNATEYGNKTEEQRHNSYSTLMRYEIADMIMDAPAVDAELVRHGRWFIESIIFGSFDDDGSWTEWRATCSECGRVEWLDPVSCECGMLKDALAEYNFCPNCGAKMEKST